MPECKVVGSDVLALDPFYPLYTLRGDEGIIVGILIERGPICQRKLLQDLAIKKGVGLASFWQCLNFRPTITRYARGVYGLTGAQVQPGQIESLVQTAQLNEVQQDHGWTRDGKVWIAYRLSQNSVETGILGMPSAKQEYVQGEFGVHSPSGVSAAHHHRPAHATTAVASGPDR